MSKSQILHKNKDTLCEMMYNKIPTNNLHISNKEVPVANIIHHSDTIYSQQPPLEVVVADLERYASYRNKFTGEILNEWEDHNITQEIYDNYWGYHTEAIENAYEDIDSLLLTGNHAY